MATTQEAESDAPDRYEVQGHEVIEKEVKAAGTGAIAYVPKAWRGERVKVVRITDSDSEQDV